MRLLLSSLVALAVVAAPVVAHATTMDDFSLTGSNLSVSFSLPANPVVSGFATGLFFYVGDVSFVENGVAKTDADMYFYTKAFNGGFTLADPFGNPIDGLNFIGKPLFNGNVDDPTFALGSFEMTPASCVSFGPASLAAKGNASPCDDLLTISAATSTPTVTPEPGSLALLGTGALGLVTVVRRRFVRQA